MPLPLLQLYYPPLVTPLDPPARSQQRLRRPVAAAAAAVAANGAARAAGAAGGERVLGSVPGAAHEAETTLGHATGGYGGFTTGVP